MSEFVKFLMKSFSKILVHAEWEQCEGKASQASQQEALSSNQAFRFHFLFKPLNYMIKHIFCD